MRLLRVLGALVVTVTLLTDTPPAAAAGETHLELEGPTSAERNGPVTLAGRLTAADGTGLPGQEVRLDRQTPTGWQQVSVAITSVDGSASWTLDFQATTTYRATFAGTVELDAVESGPVTVVGVPRRTRITVTGTFWLLDETSRRFTVRWSTLDGRPVPNAAVAIQRRTASGWRHVMSVRLDSSGTGTFGYGPRSDTRIRAVGATAAWWAGAASPTYAVDNRPPGRPVSYPAAAPRPRVLPPQRHAVGAGANPEIRRIPRKVWRSMTGRSWHRGCPVGRASLRLVRINYWDFDGYRRRGELVVRAGIARRAAAALRGMYRGRYPIRAMYRVDRFGWSRNLRGANDYASMAHDNTSAFNCRGVVGNPRVRSPHASGRAIDVNTWENPYASRAGIVPNRWWYSRSHPRIAWRSGRHPVVRIWRRHGFRWTYGVRDSQHWDGRTTPRPIGSFVADRPRPAR